MNTQRGQFVAFLAGLCVAWSMACTSALPMRDIREVITDAEIDALRDHPEIGPSFSNDMLRKAHLEQGAANWLPCSEMLAMCLSTGRSKLGLLIGEIPLACTRYFVGTERDALNYITGFYITPITYYCDATPGLALEHEAEHRRGLTHP